MGQIAIPAEEAEMRFGRFHGIALLVLGVLLLFAQAYVVLWGHSNEAARSPEQTEQSERPLDREGRAFEYLPGVLGVMLVGLGGYLFARRPEPSTNAQSSQPFSGRPV